MITTLQPLPVGNAIRVFLTPPAGATQWRVLRKGEEGFVGPEDESAIVVHDGDERVFLDAEYLLNDVPSFYCAFYLIGGQWQASNVAMATARAAYTDLSSDALDLLRDRLELGLYAECQRGTFRTRTGGIQVLTAPPTVNTAIFPTVTLTLVSDQPAYEAIGMHLGEDEYDEIEGEWLQSDGYLANCQIGLIAWSLNPNERDDLRRAIRAIVQANASVFEEAGVTERKLSLQHVDAVNGEYEAAVYQVLGTFDCLAPVRVGSTLPPITDTDVRSTNG